VHHQRPIRLRCF